MKKSFSIVIIAWAFIASIFVSFVGTASAQPVSRVIYIGAAPESPKRQAFALGESYRNLAVFEVTNANPSSTTIEYVSIGRSATVTTVYIEVEGDTNFTSSEYKDLNGASVVPFPVNKSVGFGKSIKISVYGSIAWDKGFGDAYVWVDSIQTKSSAQGFSVAGPGFGVTFTSYSAKHAVVEARPLDGVTNTSVRAVVSSGAPVVLGVSVTGDKNRTYPVLFRAIGPTLGKFGVKDFLEDPSLTVYGVNGERVQEGQNDDWNANMEWVFNVAGAFPLTKGSRDSVVMVWLRPGNYTAEVKGFGTGTGTVLIEQYQLPENFGGKG